MEFLDEGSCARKAVGHLLLAPQPPYPEPERYYEPADSGTAGLYQVALSRPGDPGLFGDVPDGRRAGYYRRLHACPHPRAEIRARKRTHAPAVQQAVKRPEFP